MVLKHRECEDTLFCALADGQGGQVGGGTAERMAVEGMAGEFNRPLNPDASLTEFWYVLVSQIDEAIVEDADAGFTTLISLFVSTQKVTGVSCGDSAALLFQGVGVRWLTENQRKNPPVGSGAAFPVVFEADLYGAWKLLLMSDGVWRYVGSEAVARLTADHDGNDLIAALRQAASDGNGGKLGDDFSVILVQSD